MPVLVGPFLALAFTLVISGIDKLARPNGAADALRAARLTRATGSDAIGRSSVLARVLGLGEAGVGVAAITVPLLWPDRPLASVGVAGVVGLVFFGFAWFVTRLAATDPGASCGCFGSGAPPGPAHRWFNLAMGALGMVVAVGVVISDQVPTASIIRDAGVGAVAASAVLFCAVVPIILLAPALLSDTDPRTLTNHNATVPAFAVTRPIGERR